MVPSSFMKFRRARLYESVRSAHLERAHVLEPATILYRERRYDFDAGLVAGLDLIQASPLRAATILWRSRPIALEINEPLMLSSLPASALALLGLKVAEILGGNRTVVVSYAIGNTNPFEQLASKNLRTRVRRKLEYVLARLIWGRLDRMAFGTAAAQSVYHELLPARQAGLKQSLIPALPSSCRCNQELEPEQLKLLFLGDLSARKGFPQLAAAWPLVQAALPDARLTIMGKGVLTDLALNLAADNPSVMTLIDPSRHEIHRNLRRAHVLALPSQKSATWREQVGLPIVEGLGHGCTIVATTQTGLASWLSENGHTALDPDCSPRSLSEALIAVLKHPMDKDTVCRQLPNRDGRLEADDWLFERSTGER